MKAQLLQAIAQHIEDMDHEISGVDLKIEQQGYRVDGRGGIKTVVGLGNRKSVDYFYVENNRCRFIEFSDLASGRADFIKLEKTHGDSEQQNLLNKLIKNASSNEMVEKFKDSKDVFHKIPHFYEDPPEPFLDDLAKTFIIVHAPIKDDLLEEDKVVITRFLRRLKASISTRLEDEICDQVRLVLLDRFVAGLG
ncbi:MAG: hypothetical protein HRT35_11465 [Algicola sp.]|nr:hypothetical protein [Algicola sp.]